MKTRRATPVDVVVGQNIRMYRKRLGLSQSELGRRIGVAQQQIQKYEDGGNALSAARLSQIAVALGVPVPSLFGRTDVDPSPRALLAKRHSVRLVQAFDRVPTERLRIMLLEMIEAVGKASRRH